MKRRSFSLAASLLAGSAGLSRGQPAWGQAAPSTPLFNGRDFDGWDRIGDANWRVEEGMIVSDRGSGFLVTKQSFRDFMLRTEFWADASTNRGIFIRASNPTTIAAANSYEINIWDERPESRYGTGAIVDVAAVDPMPRAGGRWNVFEITARGDSLSVVMNGQKTVDGVRDARFAAGPIALQHSGGLRDAAGVVNDRGVIRFRRLDLTPL